MALSTDGKGMHNHWKILKTKCLDTNDASMTSSHKLRCAHATGARNATLWCGSPGNVAWMHLQGFGDAARVRGLIWIQDPGIRT